MGRGEAAAIRLRAELGRTEEPLLDLDAVAKHLGAEVLYETLGKDVSGMLLREDDRIVIGVNQTHTSTRQRFTVAHELGHLILHKGRPLVVDAARINLRDRRSSMATDVEEIEANSFAAELLMPAVSVLREFRRLAEQGGRGYEGMRRDLAEVYGVSEQAMEYRLSNLGLLAPG